MTSPMRSATRLFLLLGLVTCDRTEEPTSPPVGGVPEPSAPRQTPTTGQTGSGLSGFFEPGNFGSLTVKGEGNEQQPLSIKSLEVSVQVVGRMARTEVRQLFHNHLARQTEGIYELTLPEGAAISRLAMDVEGKLMEGELVERERARKIYDDIVRKMKDPALLEWIGGNRFKTSIFPIPASGDKLVILGYEQLLPQYREAFDYRYSLPSVSGEQKSLVDRFSFKLEATGAGEMTVRGYPVEVTHQGLGGTVSFEVDRFRPSGPLEVNFAHAARAGARVGYTAEKGERFFVLDYLPELPAAEVGALRGLVIAIDTSASIGGRELERVKQVALALLDQLPAGVRFRLLSGDLEMATCADRPLAAATSTDLETARDCLTELTPGGGSDLDALITSAARHATELGPDTAVVLLSDGAASLGELDADLMRAHLERAIADRTTSLHTVAVGPTANHDFLRSLASAGQGFAHRLLPSSHPERLARRLLEQSREPLLIGVEVEVLDGQIEGLTPQRPVNLARGEALVVMGRLDSGDARIRIHGDYQGRTVERSYNLEATAGVHPLLRNFWARNVIGEMQRSGQPRDKVVTTSLHYGVMSRHTSFLVLENDAAYRRYQIEQRKGKEEQQRQEQEASRQAATNLHKTTESLSKVLARDTGERMASRSNAPMDRVITAEQMQSVKSVEELDGLTYKAPQIGSSSGESYGEGGLGLRGSGPGGGGSSTRMFGLGADRHAGREGQVGNISSRGRGAGSAGYGTRQIEPRSRRDRSVVSQGSPVVMGSLDKNIIRRVIRENIGQIRYCYERELVRSPDLQGRVVVKFVIAATGRVSGAEVTETALRNRSVEYCIARKVRGWRFPSPRGGGIVVVNYPFIFRSTGGQAIEPVLTLQQQYRQWIDMARRGDGEIKRFADKLLADKEIPVAEKYELIALFPRLKRLLPVRWLEVSSKLLQDHPGSYLTDYLEAVEGLDRWAQAGPVLLGLVEGGKLSLSDLVQYRTQLESHAPFKQGIARFIAEQLEQIGTARREDMGNADLITRQFELLLFQGEESRARRVLSELVEFAPHDVAARKAYSVELARLGDISGSCRNMSVLTQLNPAERQVFRDMMALRRSHEEHSADIQKCIVRGVSNLPVQRDLSLVLTWEDPVADVDLHIHEAGGEEVMYTHLESRSGGLLYYDVTDGYGPEIYVLGTAPKGRYRLTLVYYGGSAKNVKGTLTVLRHAGTPEESREDLPFFLPTEDTEKQIEIGTLTF